MKMFRLIDSKAIKVSRACRSRSGKISALFAFERKDLGGRRAVGASTLQHHIHTLRFRRPDAKMRFVFAD